MKLKIDKAIILILSAILILSSNIILSSSATAEEKGKSTAAGAKAGRALLESVSLESGTDVVEAVLKLTAPVVYSSFKTASPSRLTVDLSETSLGDTATGNFTPQGNFAGITAETHETVAGIISRVTFDLKEELEPVIKASGNEIRISFKNRENLSDQPAASAVLPKPPAELQLMQEGAEKSVQRETEPAIESRTPSPASPSNQETKKAQQMKLKSITSRKGTILLAIDGGTPEFRTFRLNAPERMIVDMIGVSSEMNQKIVTLNTTGVASARLGAYPDKIRIVFDAINGTFPDLKIRTIPEGITIVSARSDDAELAELLAAQKMTDTAKTGRNILKKELKTPGDIPGKEPVRETETAQLTVTKELKETIRKADEEKKALLMKKETPAAPLESKTEKTTSMPVAGSKTKNIKTAMARIEAIDFQVIDNISRVSIRIIGEADTEISNETAGFVTLYIRQCNIPKHLQRSFETAKFPSPLLRITPLVVKRTGGTDALIKMAMRMPAEYRLNREGDMIYVEFVNPPTKSDKPAIKSPTTPDSQKKEKIENADNKTETPEISSELTAVTAQGAVKNGITNSRYAGRKITLEFADAEVRKIFQLLSEVSNRNFVLGDEVTGSISIKLVNVPWDQALDIILDTKGLDKREEGNIIIIRGKGKFKSLADEELEIKKTYYKSIELKTETFNVNYAELPAIENQFKALKTERGTITPDIRTNKIIVKDIPQVIDDMRNLLLQLDIPEKQVMIEARIVEATSTFTRNLGVNWGVHYRDGSASFLGINRIDTGFGGLTATPPPTTGGSNIPGGAMGISFGTLTSNIQLDMRLNAAASAGMVKIVSTPKVATLNNKTAKITQGQQIPYTSATSDKIETKFVEAALSLEVTPHINANGTISLKIDAKNDSAGASSGGNAPPINKKQATTEMLLRDGETTVIGGIYVDSDTEGDEGVPFLMDIPFFGKIFKSTNKSKTKSELLVFITPRILGSM